MNALVSALGGVAAMGVAAMGFALAAFLEVSPATARQDPPPEVHTLHNVPVDADGVVTWETLSNLDVRVETPAPLQTIFHIEFPENLLALDERIVRLKGFMYPLEAGETHRSFLLSALPPACPFCLPGTATTLVDIRSDRPVTYTLEPVMLEGRLNLLKDDDTGLYYRLTEAGPVF